MRLSYFCGRGEVNGNMSQLPVRPFFQPASRKPDPEGNAMALSGEYRFQCRGGEGK